LKFQEKRRRVDTTTTMTADDNDSKGVGGGDDDNGIIPKDFVEKGLDGITDDKQKTLIKDLYKLGQSHLFEGWVTSEGDDDAGGAGAVSAETKKKLASQLMELDAAYSDGGLVGYVKNARKLLENSKKGVNPLEGWVPSVPQGENFELNSPEYGEHERRGLLELGYVGFVLVAGGLGERLGYSDIKIGLPVETTTGTSYIQYYIEYILALQKRFANNRRMLPLCIMTSNDTNAKTVDLLERNHYFGMKKNQITIVQQGAGVPSLLDNNAKIAIDPDDPSTVLTKPHGHGDVHLLLYKHGVAKKWLSAGIRWLTTFQDTNGLAFHTLPLMLGVSSELNLVMNSLAVPRKAKQAIGGIAKLTNKETGETR